MRAACESCLISFYDCDTYVRVASGKLARTLVIFINTHTVSLLNAIISSRLVSRSFLLIMIALFF